MRKVILVCFLLMPVGVTFAQTPQSAPSPGVCKADLKAWSIQKTEALTIDQIMLRINEMYACAEQQKKHEKKMRSYLDEFYRIHSELADRAFDFIESHNLKPQFYQERNGSNTEANSEPE